MEYILKHFSAVEYNYSAIEWEFVALQSELERWHHYLLGHWFVLKTDQVSLHWAQS